MLFRSQYFLEVAKNREFALVLKSPIIKTEKKKTIFDTVFTGKLDEITNGFFSIVINKGREMYLVDIAKEFVSQYRRHKHISTVKLITAVPFSEEMTKKIVDKLVASGKVEENVELVTELDPELIGGFVLQFENQRYDASVTYRLEQLERAFSENTYIKNF